MSFAGIYDQEAPLRLMRNILSRRRVPHGLLFYGPDGTGKQLTALAMAKAMNCKEAENDACGTCLSCRRIENGTFPDVKVIQPAGRGRIIAVDTVDFINDLTAYPPFEGAWRIFIIGEADRMGVPAQNHFLKTLEEPASRTLFILLSTRPRLLLETIRSRCQQVRFGALRPETVLKLIRRDHDIADERAEAIAAVSQGQMSRALDLIESGRRKLVLDLANRLQQGADPLLAGGEFMQHVNACKEAIRTAAREERAPAEELSKEDRDEQKEEIEAFIAAQIRRELQEYLYLFKTWYRDIAVYQVTGDSGHVLNRDRSSQLAAAAGLDISPRLEAIEKAWRYIERNLNVDRIFRDLFFALAP
jgi:DNA polymerase III delta' subunit